MLLLLIPIFPFLALLIQVGFFMYSKTKHIKKPKGNILVLKSIKYGFIGAVISLGFTIIWIVWYEHSSGYSAGNAPVGWILFYGPLSFSIGQIIALNK
jgi:hypothetical protein